MSEPLLDLTAVEGERRPVKIDDGDVVWMASPQTIGPRDLARIAAMQQYQSADVFDEAAAEAAESAMTEAACIVLPDVDRERVAAMPFLRRARLVEAFMSGLAQAPSGREPAAAAEGASTGAS